jgi:hypothetical protein
MTSCVADILWGVFKYNKQNFGYDRKFRQKLEYKVVDMKLEQVDLWRDDVRTLVELTLTKCEAYLLIIALLLTCCVTALCKGRVPAGTPIWLAACHTVSLTGAFMYLTLGLWLGMYAYVSAQAYKVRILTHYVRLPIPDWRTIEAARTYGSSFEKMRGGQILRVPWLMGKQESHAADHIQAASAPVHNAPAPAQDGASIPQSSSHPIAADPWGLEKRVDGRDIAELAPDVNSSPELQRHVWYVREAAQYYETCDAFCRISMSTGTCSFAFFLCYFCLSYVLTENASPVAAWAGMLSFMAIAMVLVRLDMRLTGWLYFWGSLLMLLPAFISAMTVYENSKYKQTTALKEVETEWLMPLVPFFHGIWYLAYLACFHMSVVEGESMVPHAWRSVLFLDAFAWAKQTHKSSTNLGAWTETPSAQSQPAMQVLDPAAPSRPEDKGAQPTHAELENASFDPSTFAYNPAKAALYNVDREGKDDKHPTAPLVRLQQITGVKPGSLPWVSYKWTTIFLACLWFWSMFSHIFLLMSDPKADEFGVKDTERSVSDVQDANGLSTLAKFSGSASKIPTLWGSALVRPRGLDCDRLGTVFVTSGLSASGESALMTAELSAKGLSFQVSEPCLGGDEVLEDLAATCDHQDTGCSALVLPRQGKRLVNCLLRSTRKQGSDARASPSSRPDDDLALPLHRTWLDDRGGYPIDGSLSAGGAYTLPEEISAVSVVPCMPGIAHAMRCVVVGTTARRVVMLSAAHLDASHTEMTWTPRQVLSHDVGEVPGPGAFALFGERHLGVLLRNASRLQLFDLQGGGHQSVKLPKEHRWAAVCAGKGHFFAMEDGTEPSVWRFTTPADLNSQSFGGKAAAAV